MKLDIDRACLSFRVVPFCLLMVAVAAAESAQIPDAFTNLQVFPEDVEKERLLGAMRAFTKALDVRCKHCHVGESDTSLEGYDFASDDKEPKRVARVMMKMVGDINNSHLPEMGRESPIRVRCVTCHRGLREPETLENRMLELIDEQGFETAAELYRELREEQFGSGSYDFSAAALDGVTETLAKRDDGLETAMAVNELNLEFHPDVAYTLYLKAQLQLRGGDRDGAIATLERAVEANPEVEWLPPQLERLKNPPSEN